MAIAPCPDCGGDVSSHARACPHCGRPSAANQGALALLILVTIAGAAIIYLLMTTA